MGGWVVQAQKEGSGEGCETICPKCFGAAAAHFAAKVAVSVWQGGAPLATPLRLRRANAGASPPHPPSPQATCGGKPPAPPSGVPPHILQCAYIRTCATSRAAILSFILSKFDLSAIDPRRQTKPAAKRRFAILSKISWPPRASASSGSTVRTCAMYVHILNLEAPRGSARLFGSQPGLSQFPHLFPLSWMGTFPSCCCAVAPAFFNGELFKICERERSGARVNARSVAQNESSHGMSMCIFRDRARCTPQTHKPHQTQTKHALADPILVRGAAPASRTSA